MEQLSLFSEEINRNAPLASRLRPETLDEITDVMKQAENDRLAGLKTIVFVDEIHRFNKAQQDAFLPFVEKGSIILIGATTENPSFEINSALLSRCKVFVLQALTVQDMEKLLHHALADKRGLGNSMINIEERLIRFASEDVGMADSQALQIAVAAYQACHFNGMPECNVNLAHAVVYLSMAPKSNALYVGYGKAREDAAKMLTEPVPLQIRNGVTGLMRELHYGEGYQYAHDTEEKLTRMQCLPESLQGKKYYEPTGEGQEAKIKEKLEQIEKYRNKKD